MKRDELRDLLIAGYAALLTKAVDLDPKTAKLLDNMLRRPTP
jgi:hypothetical protein